MSRTSPVFLFVAWTFAEPFSVKSFALSVAGQNSEIASFDAISSFSSALSEAPVTFPFASIPIILPSVLNAALIASAFIRREPFASSERSSGLIPTAPAAAKIFLARKLSSSSIVTFPDRKGTRLNSSHLVISYAVFCLKKKKQKTLDTTQHINHSPCNTQPQKSSHQSHEKCQTKQ